MLPWDPGAHQILSQGGSDCVEQLSVPLFYSILVLTQKHLMDMRRTWAWIVWRVGMRLVKPVCKRDTWIQCVKSMLLELIASTTMVIGSH